MTREFGDPHGGNGCRPNNVLLMAGPATRPDHLLTLLGRHPDIAAAANVDVGQRLFRAARSTIRKSRSGVDGFETRDLVGLGRAEGAAELSRLYEGVRAESGAEVVVLHDPSGPLFPFPGPPDVSLLVLVRNAEAAAAAIGAIGIERVIAAARDALSAFQARVAGFGVSVDRLVTVEEDRLIADPEIGLAEICRTLGVAFDAATVSAMLAPARLDARFEGSP